jgi:hypothetical protein
MNLWQILATLLGGQAGGLNPNPLASLSPPLVKRPPSPGQAPIVAGRQRNPFAGGAGGGALAALVQGAAQSQLGQGASAQPSLAIGRKIPELRGIKDFRSTGTGYWYTDPMTGVEMYGGGPGMATPRKEIQHYKGVLRGLQG